jgi:hypothetical protein
MLTDSDEPVLCHSGAAVSDYSTSFLQVMKNVRVHGPSDITIFWNELKQWSPHCQLLLAFPPTGHPPAIS